ncbi:Uncharacterised protein [Mycobacteroides abscessus subsp. abscessus]|nr:Uncharacterised protein [Mycobacteroides abscessus subsp. abscessus]
MRDLSVVNRCFDRTFRLGNMQAGTEFASLAFFPDIREAEIQFFCFNIGEFKGTESRRISNKSLADLNQLHVACCMLPSSQM